MSDGKRQAPGSGGERDDRAVNQRAIDLYDEYTHAPLPRRVFLERLAVIAGGAAAAAALLPILENDEARAQTVDMEDKRIKQAPIFFGGAKDAGFGVLARPKKVSGNAPGVVVVHENRGLNGHIADVGRRLAVEGFFALSPDLLSSLGGTPRDPDEARDRIASLDPARALSDLRTATTWLTRHNGVNGKVGAVGFCWGGGMVNNLAEADPTLKAGVVFYGVSPALDKVAAIKAPLLLHYAELDDRVNATVPDYEAALKAAGKNYTVYRYPGVQHAFHNDTNTARYNKAAATLAWQRTIDFLKKTLA